MKNKITEWLDTPSFFHKDRATWLGVALAVGIIINIIIALSL